MGIGANRRLRPGQDLRRDPRVGKAIPAVPPDLQDLLQAVVRPGPVPGNLQARVREVPAAKRNNESKQIYRRKQCVQLKLKQ